MDSTSSVILINLALFLVGLGVGVICHIAWRRKGGAKLVGIAAMFGLWLLLTVGSMTVVIVIGYMAFFPVLFWLGYGVAVLVAILVLTFLVSIPFLWGWTLSRPGVQR